MYPAILAISSRARGQPANHRPAAISLKTGYQNDHKQSQQYSGKTPSRSSRWQPQQTYRVRWAAFRKNGADVKAIVETCIRLAKQREADAKLVLDWIAPVRKGALLHFPPPPIRNMDDVVAAYDGLLQAVSQGLITSGEAVELSTVIDRLRQGLDSSETDRRLATIEAELKKWSDVR